MIYINNNQDLEDDQEWFEGLDNVDKPDMNEAVKIQDPISNMHLGKPLIVDLGTSLRHVLDTMQNNNRNCVLTLKDNKLGGILTERDILLKVTGKGYDFNLTVIDEFITLEFTIVLNQIMLGFTDEDEDVKEPADRDYWINRGSETTVKMSDRLLNLIHTFDNSYELKYNKYYITKFFFLDNHTILRIFSWSTIFLHIQKFLLI